MMKLILFPLLALVVVSVHAQTPDNELPDHVVIADDEKATPVDKGLPVNDGDDADMTEDEDEEDIMFMLLLSMFQEAAEFEDIPFDLVESIMQDQTLFDLKVMENIQLFDKQMSKVVDDAAPALSTIFDAIEADTTAFTTAVKEAMDASSMAPLLEAVGRTSAETQDAAKTLETAINKGIELSERAQEKMVEDGLMSPDELEQMKHLVSEWLASMMAPSIDTTCQREAAPVVEEIPTNPALA